MAGASFSCQLVEGFLPITKTDVGINMSIHEGTPYLLETGIKCYWGFSPQNNYKYKTKTRQQEAGRKPE